ncbi:hypothetical protein ACFVJS_18195 [Nocardioides sp. NPDC057772]|uniref:hypothetical protein n=1 Tax=Nocardioides sp. NPDC057772 TaxID=3346245 RepID=UPI00366A76C7
MSRRLSAVATMVVLGVFAWFYVFAMAVPIRPGDAYTVWADRGQAWFGALVSRFLNGLSFLWGSMVRDEYAAAPETALPTVLFVVLVAVLTYASLRSGTASVEGAVGRVLGACLLAAGFTNLLLIVLATSRLADEGAISFSEVLPPGLDGAIWLGIALGVVGGVAASVSVVLAQLAAELGAGDGSDPAETASVPVAQSAPPSQVATWGVLPLLALVLVGGFVWDYGPDADPDAVGEPGATWLRLVWFAHARFAAPHDPHALSGTFETSVWLPRTLSSAVLIVLVWLGVRLLVARWRRGDEPKALGIVLQCWGLIAVLAAVVGLVEGAVAPAPDQGPAAHYLALSNVAAAVRFGTCFGWLIGLAVALAHRLGGVPAAETVPADQVLERGTD